MFEEKRSVSLFITNSRIGFFAPKTSKKNTDKHGYIDLEKDIIRDGIIVEPEIFYEKMLTLFKLNEIKPHKIKYTLSDNNLLIREITVSKEDLKKQSIDHYLSSLLNQGIHTPFKQPSFIHHVINEDSTIYKLILFISNSDIMHDFLDVFDRLGVKHVAFDIPSLSFYNAYLNSSVEKQATLMMVILYERQFSIKIIEDKTPIFSIIEESDNSTIEYFEVVENYIERIANYYQYNLKKGGNALKHIAFFNMSEDITMKMIEEKLISRIISYQSEIIDPMHLKDNLSAMPKVCQASFISTMPADNSLNIYDNINLHLHIAPKINQLLHIILAFSTFIFLGVLMVYLPFQSIQSDINSQQGINNNLNNQLEILIRETPQQKIYTPLEINYSNAYDILSSTESAHTDFLLNLFGELEAGMSMSNFSINQNTQTITLIIVSSQSTFLDAYVINIYEKFGVHQYLEEDTRWISERPTFISLSPIAREVTIKYA